MQSPRRQKQKGKSVKVSTGKQQNVQGKVLKLVKLISEGKRQ